MSLHFGIFDSFDLNNGNAGELLDDRLRFAATAERLGISHYHVTEHHGTPLSVCPSPNIFTAALTQRTSSMRIGALVNVLPAYDPFRLAEEIAALDQLAHGRLDLGVGAGVSPIELSLVRGDVDNARAVYQETLAAVTGALATGRMTHEGTLLRTYDAALSVLPVQRPYPQLWYASGNAASAEWAGANSINFVGRWESGAIADIADTYWTAWAKDDDHELRLNPGVTDPRVGISGPVVVASSTAEAQDVFESANALHEQRVLHLWHERGDHRLDGVFSSERVQAAGNAVYGTVSDVRDRIVAQVEQADINYYEMKIFFGDVTLAQAEHTAREVMEKIAPAARAAAVRTSRFAHAS
jgi:alkanesulfonate monooxygenase SsuD/methylene tetrahydromethanopterin reductase-like flavin-dependent oxidoreductase (luciferase family)